jgi:hypothetical protein
MKGTTTTTTTTTTNPMTKTTMMLTRDVRNAVLKFWSFKNRPKVVVSRFLKWFEVPPRGLESGDHHGHHHSGNNHGGGLQKLLPNHETYKYLLQALLQLGREQQQYHVGGNAVDGDLYKLVELMEAGGMKSVAAARRRQLLSSAIEMDGKGEGKPTTTTTTTTTTKVQEDPLECLLCHLVEKPLRYQLSQPAHKKHHHHHHDATNMKGTATTITAAAAGDYENMLLDASDDVVGPGTWDLLMAAYATLGMAEKVMDCFEILVGGGGGKGGKGGSKGGMMTKSEDRLNSVSERVQIH